MVEAKGVQLDGCRLGRNGAPQLIPIKVQHILVSVENVDGKAATIIRNMTLENATGRSARRGASRTAGYSGKHRRQNSGSVLLPGRSSTSPAR